MNWNWNEVTIDRALIRKEMAHLAKESLILNKCPKKIRKSLNDEQAIKAWDDLFRSFVGLD